MQLALALRHMIRHWRPNCIVLAGVLLGTILLSALTMYAAVIAGQSLSQSLIDAYPSVRNIKVSGAGLTDKTEAEIRSALGPLVARRVDVYDLTVDAKRTIFGPDGDEDPVPEFLYLRLWAFEPFAEHIALLSGRLPAMSTADVAGSPVVVEAAIGVQAAEHAKLELGDELAFADGTQRVRITGIVRALDPEAEMWWGDQNLVPFGYERHPTVTGVDELYLSFLLQPETVQRLASSEDRYWRVLLHWNAIAVDNAVATRNKLANLAARLAKEPVKMETGLVSLIDDYQGQLALSRVSLLLLTAQSLVAVLYTLTAISSLVLERSRSEIASLSARGYSRSQIAGLFAVQNSLLTFGIALPLGPVLAYLGFRLWELATSHAAPRAIPGESWWLSLIAATSGWLALTLPLYVTARSNLADWQRTGARPPRKSVLQRLSLDFFLLVLGGLAYWQLRQTGSFVREANGISGTPATGAAGADPVLLLGPSLLLLAIGLVGLRVFPLVLGVTSRLTQALRGLVVPLGFTRLARDPRAPNRVVLLISLTAGLLFFVTVFEDSIAQQQAVMAHYRTGADMRLRLPLDAQKAEAGGAQIANLPGVMAASPIYRARSQWSAHRVGGVNYMNLTLCAVDSGSFPLVAAYPAGMGHQTMAQVLESLKHEPGNGILPILLSPDAPPQDARRGDRIDYMIGQHAYAFEVQGRVEHFPTIERPFAITSLPALEKQIDISAIELTSIGARELWLDIDPAQRDALVVALQRDWFDAPEVASTGAGGILGDAQAQLRSLQADLVAQMTTSAFGINALTLVVLSCGSFVLVQALSAHHRRVEFSVLRAMGLSARQLLSLLALEGIGMILLGLLAGTGMGYGLAYILRPFLSITLASSLGDSAIGRIVIDWSTIARLYAGLASVYIVALLVLLAGLLRANIHRVLRIGDE